MSRTRRSRDEPPDPGSRHPRATDRRLHEHRQHLRVPVLRRVRQEGPRLSPGNRPGGGGTRHAGPHHDRPHLDLPCPAGAGQEGYGTVRHAAQRCWATSSPDCPTGRSSRSPADVSLSTIRNHRFALREKARQARVFLALMDLLAERGKDPGPRFIEIPGTKSADDERFAITQAEFDKVVRSHFPDGPDGRLSRFPKKQKRKVAVLIQILEALRRDAPVHAGRGERDPDDRLGRLHDAVPVPGRLRIPGADAGWGGVLGGVGDAW